MGTTSTPSPPRPGGHWLVPEGRDRILCEAVAGKGLGSLEALVLADALEEERDPRGAWVRRANPLWRAVEEVVTSPRLDYREGELSGREGPQDLLETTLTFFRATCRAVGANEVWYRTQTLIALLHLVPKPDHFQDMLGLGHLGLWSYPFGPDFKCRYGDHRLAAAVVHQVGFAHLQPDDTGWNVPNLLVATAARRMATAEEWEKVLTAREKMGDQGSEYHRAWPGYLRLRAAYWAASWVVMGKTTELAVHLEKGGV